MRVDGSCPGRTLTSEVRSALRRTAREATGGPARWVAPAGFNRMLVDDDGDRPVTTLRRGSRVARLTVGAPLGSTDIAVTPDALERLGVTAPGTADALRWGILELPELSVVRDPRPDSVGWGDDGKVGFAMLMRFHSHLDLTHRWIYVQPLGR